MQHVFFMDIETISAYPTLAEAPEPIQELFKSRFHRDIAESNAEHVWKRSAALYAEFGKIVCISIGRLFKDQKADSVEKFYIRTFVDKDEVKILKQASEALLKAHTACGHNLKEFDGPFFARRCMAHGLPVPAVLNAIGVKPWDLRIEDTMVMWSGSAWNYRVSLDLLAATLGIPSPKGDMSGSQVGEVWYNRPKEELPFDAEERIYRKIGTYCNGDVVTTANVYCRMKLLPPITPDMLEFIEPMFKTNVQTALPI